LLHTEKTASVVGSPAKIVYAGSDGYESRVVPRLPFAAVSAGHGAAKLFNPFTSAGMLGLPALLSVLADTAWPDLTYIHGRHHAWGGDFFPGRLTC